MHLPGPQLPHQRPSGLALVGEQPGVVVQVAVRLGELLGGPGLFR